MNAYNEISTQGSMIVCDVPSAHFTAAHVILIGTASVAIETHVGANIATK